MLCGTLGREAAQRGASRPLHACHTRYQTCHILPALPVCCPASSSELLCAGTGPLRRGPLASGLSSGRRGLTAQRRAPAPWARPAVDLQPPRARLQPAADRTDRFLPFLCCSGKPATCKVASQGRSLRVQPSAVLSCSQLDAASSGSPLQLSPTTTSRSASSPSQVWHRGPLLSQIWAKTDFLYVWILFHCVYLLRERKRERRMDGWIDT
jgi:hypothetical protein